ncbi:MAG: glucosaminidase domain-containing protein, partial [Bacteroidota bacterium]
SHALESFEDHSKFLRNRPRYASLFELDCRDYKGWAHGLKRAGYATDPAYARRLSEIIEMYQLHQYDEVTGAATLSASNDKSLTAPPPPKANQAWW